MSSNCHRQRLRPELRWKRPPEQAERAELALVSLLERMGRGRPLELEHWRRWRLALVWAPECLAAALGAQGWTAAHLGDSVSEQALAAEPVAEGGVGVFGAGAI